MKDKREGPKFVKNKLTKKEREKIIEICNSEEYRDLSSNLIVPKLADKGIYIASESSFYRVLRKKDMLAHRRKSKKPQRKKKPATHCAKDSNQVWTWDITYLKTNIKGIFYYLYLIVDIYDRCITGFRVEEKQSSVLAAELVSDSVLKRNADSNKLVLHADNGGPMKGSTMAVTLVKLGITKTFNRPSVSNDNSFSESLFKTLKYDLINPLKPFENIEEARKWVKTFVEWYNNCHLHSGIKYVTPNQRFDKEDITILKRRKAVYYEAMKNNPQRWINNKIRNWNIINSVTLNERKDQIEGHLS